MPFEINRRLDMSPPFSMSACYLLNAGFLSGVFIDPED
jgi:hypothetical protein